MYILDAYYGLFKLDIAKESAVYLIQPSTHIVIPTTTNNKDTTLISHSIDNNSIEYPLLNPIITEYDPKILYTPKFYNDLDLSSDGRVIIFTDSSYKFTRSENREEILDGAPRGRVFKYVRKTQYIYNNISINLYSSYNSLFITYICQYY